MEITKIYYPNLQFKNKLKLNIRIIYSCNKQQMLTDKVIENINNDPNILQVEFPPLNCKNIDILERKIKKLDKRVCICVNDYGAIKFFSEHGFNISLGRIFNKSLNKIPENLRIPNGNLLTFDCIPLLAGYKTINLPNAGSSSIEYFTDIGVKAIDLDLLSYNHYMMEDNKLKFDINLHLYDTFMAYGEFCIFKNVYKRCIPNMCVSNTDSFKYTYFSDNNIETYDIDFFYKGKFLYYFNTKVSKNLYYGKNKINILK